MSGLEFLPSFTQYLWYWPWLVLASLPPLLILLYFLKLKRRPLEVPSTFLWHRTIEDLHDLQRDRRFRRADVIARRASQCAVQLSAQRNWDVRCGDALSDKTNDQ